MASDWPQVKLGPLCSKIGSGATPRGGEKVYLAKGDIALIRSQNVHNDGFKTDGVVYIAEEHADQLANVTVEPHDVLLNITGDSVARCCQVDPSVLPARVNQHVAIIRPRPSDLNPRFLRYFLVSPRMQAQMLGWAHAGATRNALTKGMIESFNVPKPPIPVQDRIADVLGKLDDKIELNRRMNRTLEKMAAAMFKSWFIDFDPVHAKAEGRLPALSDRQAGGRQATPASPSSGAWVVYALECDGGSLYIGHTQDLKRRFEEHAAGKGADWTKTHPPRRVAYWEQQPSQSAAVAREKKLKTGSGREWLKAEIARRDALTVDTTGLPALPAGQAGDIADLFPDSFEDSDIGPIPKGWKSGSLGDVADSPRRGVKPSDVPPTTPYIGLEHMPRRNIALDAWGRAENVASGKSQFKQGEILFGKLRPYFHKVGIAPVDGVCSTDIVVVTPKASHWHGYVISLVSSKAFVDYTDSHSAGTKMPRTNWKDMSRYPLALPPEPLAKAFQDHVAALHKRIGVNVRQNRRLAGLRDTLLPKLLSGEIELPNVEQAMGRAV